MAEDTLSEFEDAWKVLAHNICRVRSLIRQHKSLVKMEKSEDSISNTERTSRLNEDILRAAWVLVHAGMEDFLRSLLKWKLKNDYYDKIGIHLVKTYIPVKCRDRKPKCKPNEIVKEYLKKHYSVGNKDKIVSSLVSMGICEEKAENYDYGDLDELMDRRHQIVHSADRNFEVKEVGVRQENKIEIESIQKYTWEVKKLSKFVRENIKKYEA